MTTQERKHFDKLYNKLLTYNKDKQLKNKAVLRFLDLVSYLLKTVPYTIDTTESEIYTVRFVLSDTDIFTVRHYVGFIHNSSVVIIFDDNTGGTISKRPIFNGNRTKRNLLANVNRMFNALPDTVKCELYLKGAKINYELTDIRSE